MDLISFQLLEMELIPFGIKEEEKTWSAGGRQAMHFLACLEISYGELHT